MQTNVFMVVLFIPRCLPGQKLHVLGQIFAVNKWIEWTLSVSRNTHILLCRYPGLFCQNGIQKSLNSRYKISLQSLRCLILTLQHNRKKIYIQR